LQKICTEVGDLATVVYRPPPSKANGLTSSGFFDEWSSFLERFTDIQEEIILMGDFNFQTVVISQLQLAKLLMSCGWKFYIKGMAT